MTFEIGLFNPSFSKSLAFAGFIWHLRETVYNKKNQEMAKHKIRIAARIRWIQAMDIFKKHHGFQTDVQIFVITSTIQ